MDELAVEEILEPPWSCDDEARAIAQVPKLLSFGESADDQSRGRELFAAQCVVLLDDLHGEFARGNEHQRGHSRRALLQEPFDDRDQEGQRLAGACLSRGEHIFAFKCLRNRGGLHRRRLRKASGRQPFFHVLRNR